MIINSNSDKCKTKPSLRDTLHLYGLHFLLQAERRRGTHQYGVMIPNSWEFSHTISYYSYHILLACFHIKQWVFPNVNEQWWDILYGRLYHAIPLTWLANLSLFNIFSLSLSFSCLSAFFLSSNPTCLLQTIPVVSVVSITSALQKVPGSPEHSYITDESPAQLQITAFPVPYVLRTPDRE